MTKNKVKVEKVKAWIIENGRSDTDQMLVYQTRKAAQEEIYNGGFTEVCKVYPCEITIIL